MREGESALNPPTSQELQMRTAHRLTSCTVILAGLALAACRPGHDDATSARAAGSAVPTLPASITGTVTGIGADRRIRIEERPGDASGSAKAVVRLSADATVVTRAGVAARFEDIGPGARVSAWFVGPVMESYPVQATANVIVIEGTGP